MWFSILVNQMTCEETLKVLFSLKKMRSKPKGRTRSVKNIHVNTEANMFCTLSRGNVLFPIEDRVRV